MSVRRKASALLIKAGSNALKMAPDRLKAGSSVLHTRVASGRRIREGNSVRRMGSGLLTRVANGRRTREDNSVRRMGSVLHTRVASGRRTREDNSVRRMGSVLHTRVASGRRTREDNSVHRKGSVLHTRVVSGRRIREDNSVRRMGSGLLTRAVRPGLKAQAEQPGLRPILLPRSPFALPRRGRQKARTGVNTSLKANPLLPADLCKGWKKWPPAK